MREPVRWIPGLLLGMGVLVNAVLVTGRVRPTPLAAPISGIQRVFDGIAGTDVVVGEDEQRVAGFTDYILRTHDVDGVPRFSVYVGYYDEQRQGKTIHSPRNCLPGAGWEPVDSRVEQVALPSGDTVTVNRYHIVRGADQSIVYYWYQGRGRVAANEYAVKYELLRDAALRGRTEEALVRIVVPVGDDGAPAADAMATRVARELIPAVGAVLPSF
ncbi:MAG: exosortase C-terminal domain/associated protein EpsI [Gemmatimonadales bacterium]